MFSLIIEFIKKILSFFKDSPHNTTTDENVKLTQENLNSKDIKSQETKTEENNANKEDNKNVKKDENEDKPLTKRQEKKKKKKELKEAKAKRGIRNSIFFTITVLVLLFIYLFQALTLAFGSKVRISAHLQYNEFNNNYDIVYDFEKDINNIFYDTREGDKLPLNKMVLNTTNRKVKVLKIDRESGIFVTSLPHTIPLLYYPKIDFDENYRRTNGRVILTLRIGFGQSKIVDLEPCFI